MAASLMKRRVFGRHAALIATAVLALALGGCSSSGANPAPSSAIVREDLGSTLATTAAGQRLGLWHYLIPAGTALAPHRHPGWQVARIVAGTLDYTIIAGQASVIRADGSTETHGAGETVVLTTGDTVVENPDLEHFGANKGTVTVEIYTASLFQDGQPPAIPVTAPSPSASPSS